MPSPTTALQLIEDGLSLTDAVGSDQTLTTDELALGLRVFNDLLEDWSTQNLAVYGGANQTFSTVIGQATYTIGTGGNWNTPRPVRINDPAYSTVNGATQPCISMVQEEYNLIPVKTQTQDFPNRYLYINSFPLGVVTLWPVPSAVVPLTFTIDTILSSVAAGGTIISFPPGYAKAFKYALAVELASEFGTKLQNYPAVVDTANKTFANIKRANKTLRLMGFDPAYTSGGIPTLSAFIGGYY